MTKKLKLSKTTLKRLKETLPRTETSLKEVVGGLVNPVFLALDRTGQYLYTVHGKDTGVTAFRIDD